MVLLFNGFIDFYVIKKQQMTQKCSQCQLCPRPVNNSNDISQFEIESMISENVMFLSYKYGPGSDHMGLEGTIWASKVVRMGFVFKHAHRKSVPGELTKSSNGRVWFHFKPEIIWVQF